MTPTLPADRYLTEDAKRRILADWHARRAARPPDWNGDPDRHAGEGWPDPAIFPLCDALNALPGVCTLQSCAGHRRTTPEGAWIEPGCLWLAFSAPLFRAACARVHDLLALPSITEASVRYGRWPQDVFEIAFDGAERGSLDVAMVDILSFVQSLTEEPA